MSNVLSFFTASTPSTSRPARRSWRVLRARLRTGELRIHDALGPRGEAGRAIVCLGDERSQQQFRSRSRALMGLADGHAVAAASGCLPAGASYRIDPDLPGCSLDAWMELGPGAPACFEVARQLAQRFAELQQLGQAHGALNSRNVRILGGRRSPSVVLGGHAAHAPTTDDRRVLSRFVLTLLLGRRVGSAGERDGALAEQSGPVAAELRRLEGGGGSAAALLDALEQAPRASERHAAWWRTALARG